MGITTTKEVQAAKKMIVEISQVENTKEFQEQLGELKSYLESIEYGLTSEDSISLYGDILALTEAKGTNYFGFIDELLEVLTILN